MGPAGFICIGRLLVEWAGTDLTNGHNPTILAFLLVASAAPALAEPADVRASNVEFLLEFIGIDPDAGAVLTDGRELTIREAIGLAADRVRETNLAQSVAASPARELPDAAGDVWVLERGAGPCTTSTIASQPLSVPLHPRVALHRGYLGEMSTGRGDSTTIFSWTTGRSITNEDTYGFRAVGSIDAFCVMSGGKHFALPFVDGVVFMN